MEVSWTLERYKNVSSLAQKLSEVSIFQMQEMDLLERKHQAVVYLL